MLGRVVTDKGELNLCCIVHFDITIYLCCFVPENMISLVGHFGVGHDDMDQDVFGFEFLLVFVLKEFSASHLKAFSSTSVLLCLTLFSASSFTKSVSVCQKDKF